MKRLLLVTLLTMACGCPGQRRPPPQEEVAPPTTNPAPPSEQPADPPPLGPGVAGLKDGLAEVKRLKASFSGGRPAHDQLMGRINALQTRGFDLQETTGGAELDELYALLEEIEILRDEAVALEPK